MHLECTLECKVRSRSMQDAFKVHARCIECNWVARLDASCIQGAFEVHWMHLECTVNAPYMHA